VTWKQDESCSREDRSRSASRGGVFLWFHSWSFALCPCTAVSVVCVIYCFKCFEDGFEPANQCAQGGLLRPLFCIRQLSVAGALCHNVRTCVFFYVSVEDKTPRVSGDGIGESLRTCCCFLIIFSTQTSHGLPSPPSDVS
jgi:hypothetical protein